MIKLARSIYYRHINHIKTANDTPPGLQQTVQDVMTGRWKPQDTTKYPQNVNTTSQTQQQSNTANKTNTTAVSKDTTPVQVKPGSAKKVINAVSGKWDPSTAFKGLAPSVTYTPKNSIVDSVTISPLQDIPINLDKDSRNPNNPADDRPLYQNPYRSDSIPVDFGLQIKGKFR